MLRHHRLQALLATAAVGALAATGLAIAGPASAADSTVSLRPGTASSSTGFWSDTCPLTEPDAEHQQLADDAKSVASSLAVVDGETAGNGAWQYSPAAGSEGGPSFQLSSPSTITSLGIRARGTAPAVEGRLVAYYQASSRLFYLGVSDVSLSGTDWQTVDTSGSMLWFKKQKGLLGGWTWSPAYPKSLLDPTNQPHSLAQFASDLNASSLLVSYEFGCTGSTVPFQIDSLSVKRSTGTTTYDFDKPGSTSKLSPTSSTVTGGGSVALQVSVVDNYTKSAPSGDVELQSAPGGSSTFTTLKTLPASSTTTTVSPTATTQYKLVYPGSAATAASSSSPVTVTVNSSISAAASARYVAKGKTYKISGSTSPVTPGATVSLQQNSAGSWSTIATTKTTSSGSYSFTRTATTRGSQSLRVVLSGSGAISSPITVTTMVSGTVKIKATPHKPRPHKKITVTGTISPARSAKVKIQRFKGKQWKTIGTATTNSKGHFTYKFRGTGKPAFIPLRATTAASGDIVAGTSTTKNVVVTAKTKTTAHLSTRTITVGKAFHVTGRITPKHKGAVYLEVLANHKWVAIAAKTTTRKGKYNVKATMPWTGVWKMRVLLAPALGYSGSHSGTSVLTVKPVATTAPTTTTHTPTSGSGGSSGGGSTGTGGVGHG